MNSNKLFFISLLLIFFNVFNSDLENQGDFKRFNELPRRQIQGRRTDVRSERHHEVNLCNPKFCKLLAFVGYMTFMAAGIVNTITATRCGHTIHELFHNNQTLSDIGYRDCSITVASSVGTSFSLMLIGMCFIFLCKI